MSSQSSFEDVAFAVETQNSLQAKPKSIEGLRKEGMIQLLLVYCKHFDCSLDEAIAYANDYLDGCKKSRSTIKSDCKEIYNKEKNNLTKFLPPKKAQVAACALVCCARETVEYELYGTHLTLDERKKDLGCETVDNRTIKKWYCIETNQLSELALQNGLDKVLGKIIVTIQDINKKNRRLGTA